MEISRQTAVVFGLLLISAIVCGVFSSVPAIEKPDYLLKLESIETGVLLAVFCQAMMAIIYVAIAVITYPIVKMYSEKGALAYLVFRAIGATFLFVGIITLLLLLALGRQYTHADAGGMANLELVGALLRQARDWLNHIGMILPWSIGGLFLYTAFYQTKLIPHWMSVWGLAGTALTLTATILYMLGLIQIVTPAYLVLNVPTALLEITLAIYLIARGFRQPVLVKKSISGK